MMKYLIGIGALVVIVVGYVMLVPEGNSRAPSPARVAEVPGPRPAPVAAPVEPPTIIAQDVAPTPPGEDALLEEMAADARERLPSAISGTLTQTDARFFPRMRIMEYSYVTTAADARNSALNMRTMIEANAERICIQGRQMFAMGVTLRNSFEDREGNLLQRVYLLPEDCLRFY
jgi:hypothetical protein